MDLGGANQQFVFALRIEAPQHHTRDEAVLDTGIDRRRRVAGQANDKLVEVRAVVNRLDAVDLGQTPARVRRLGEVVERQLVVAALEKCDWNQKNAAALLDISVDRMNSRVRKFGLKHTSWKVHK